MKTDQFGWHLTLDFYGCPKNNLDDMNLCYEILMDLPIILKMNKLMPPYLIKADSNENEGGKDPGGFTGYVVIAESHISLHSFPRRGFVSMDIYSCKEFDYDKAIEFLKHKLQPTDIEEHRIDRGTRYPVENIYS